MIPRAWRSALAALLLAGVGLVDLVPGREPGLPSRASAAEPWRTEFDAICAGTQDAMVLPVEELRSLVARSDKLLVELRKLEPTERKVFTRRLEACRNLYQFVLDTRGKG